MTRRVARAVLLAATLAAALTTSLTGCSGGGDEPPAAAPSSASPTASEPTPTPTAAKPAPRPVVGACYRLTYAQAIAPTTTRDRVRCRDTHTSLTYAVGTIDAVQDGHLLAVDSRRVQAQVAADCPQGLPRFLGATQEALRLSMLRAVWFTPTLEESDAGADWYRCDVIAVSVAGQLAPLSGLLEGALSGPDGRDRYGMCGTAEPGTEAFSRVICSRTHSWRAIRTVGFAGAAYPGVDRVRDAGETPCEDAGRASASDALNFQWGYEWPTAEQWNAGQHYGLCWIPD